MPNNTFAPDKYVFFEYEIFTKNEVFIGSIKSFLTTLKLNYK
jgi:hypothetical protein